MSEEKPVAYVNSMCNDYIDWKADPMSIDGQPLYTHPAKTPTLVLDGNRVYPAFKTLTDEEIGEIYWELYCDDWTEEDIKFARAILRKAQEK